MSPTVKALFKVSEAFSSSKLERGESLSGSERVKHDPSPALDSTVISPPKALAIF